MDEFTINRVADFFDVGELAEYLGISTKDLVLAFLDEVSEALEDIDELMEYKHG